MTETASTTNTPATTSRTGSSSENASEQTDSLSVLDLSGGALLAQKIKGRENKRLKAARLLVTGRLRVLRVDRDFIAAEVRGDSGEIYNLLWRDQRWTCSCKARTDCSHLGALWAVVAVNTERQPE